MVQFFQVKQPKDLRILKHDAVFQVSPFLCVKTLRRFPGWNNHDYTHTRSVAFPDINNVAKPDLFTVCVADVSQLRRA